jgi:DME family drug/metabolite transporter
MKNLAAMQNIRERLLPCFHALSQKHPYLVRFLGILAVLVSAAFWGSEGFPVRVGCSSGLTPLTLAFYRAFFSALILAIVAVAKHRVDLLVPRKRELAACVLGGFFAVALGQSCAAFAMNVNPIGLTFLLFNTAPFWVMVLARIFWKEPVTPFQMAALVLGIAGVWVSVGGVSAGQRYNVLGILAALGTGFSYAAYVLNGRHGMGNQEPFKAFVQMFIWGAFFLFVVIILTEHRASLLPESAEGWASVMYIAMFPSVTAFGLLMLALRVLPGSVAAIVSMAEIPFGMLWSWLFLSEIPASSALKGGLLIVSAVIILSLEIQIRRFFEARSRKGLLGK